MKRFIVYLTTALILAACGQSPSQGPREVQEGHGGDGYAAQFVYSAHSAAAQLFYESNPESAFFARMKMLEMVIQNTAVHSTDNLDAYQGTDVRMDDRVLGRWTKAPRGNAPVLMLDRKVMGALMAHDHRAQMYLPGPALKAYLAIAPLSQFTWPDEVRDFKLKISPSTLVVLEKQTWPDVTKGVLDLLSDSRLHACSGFDWLSHLVETVPVEATDDKLIDVHTGLEVDAITIDGENGKSRILYNRAREASTPIGTPRSLLRMHEYLRSAEDPRMQRDEYYKLSSDLALQSAWQAPLARAAAAGTAEYAAGTVNLCRDLHLHFGLPQE